MAGVTIGHGAVIGAGPSSPGGGANDTVVAGVPARLLRRRVTDEQEEARLGIAWWDGDHHRFGAAIPDFRTLSIAAFIETYDEQ